MKSLGSDSISDENDTFKIIYRKIKNLESFQFNHDEALSTTHQRYYLSPHIEKAAQVWLIVQSGFYNVQRYIF